MNKKIKVGISEFKPLIINLANKYTGFEIELWEIIANKLNIDFQYKKIEFNNLLEETSKGNIDIAMAGITRTKKREEKVNFSYYTLRSGLSILISKRSKLNITTTIKNIITENYKKSIKFLLIFSGFIFLISNLFWFYEKINPQISDNYKHGIIDSLWWTVTMMSGVGSFYPESPMGKTIGFLVVFFGITIFAIFIAKITSVATINEAKYKINKPEDLRNKLVATKEKTTAVDELEKLGAKIITKKKIEEAFEDLRNKKVNAVVFDQPVIKNFIKDEKQEEFILTGETFDRQTYGFAFPHESLLRERVNREILGLIESGEYNLLYKKWFE
ncbi:MAG: transporter substrate-binding domain-containing protein [Patescibacteria group bacterium]|nr:transporter substrate-binding domain-containing protein [Patescibacteria group bacterium]